MSTSDGRLWTQLWDLYAQLRTDVFLPAPCTGIAAALLQEVKHIRQRACDNGEVFEELGRDRGRQNGSAAGGEAKNGRTAASDVARVSRDVIT